MRRNLPPAEMERAVRDRDGAYDGIFLLGVRTTGVFCRPSCPARNPRPQNTEYFATAQEALLAGYRPCKRCRPMDANGRPPDWVERLMSMVEADPTQRLTDADLRAASIDPVRARRYFGKHYGMTFQTYHRARRMGLALARIRQGGELTGVALDHGFESNSGFREAFAKLFGQPPGAARGASCIVSRQLETPIGPFVAGATDEGVCLLEFADRRALETQLKTLRARLGCAIVPGDNRHLQTLADELARYFDGKLTRFTVPLVIRGTPFQESVWRRLLEIPYGETLSYGELARAVGRPGAQRAVGQANGANRIAVVVPCHRVVQQNGELRGYGGGLWRKRFLLDLEQAHGEGGTAGLFAPGEHAR
ncbi:MAG TPA: methylated-DNA--[protein]-cysteine S-methyltransferase [Phycisphaerae bacterium]|nr:methylated-DNA--[protein]-cysteine S-methyltransferase [Phycisphaerae bacterium]